MDEDALAVVGLQEAFLLSPGAAAHRFRLAERLLDRNALREALVQQHSSSTCAPEQVSVQEAA